MSASNRPKRVPYAALPRITKIKTVGQPQEGPQTKESQRVSNAAKQINVASTSGSLSTPIRPSNKGTPSEDDRQDTRMFSEPRLSSLHGYEALPHVIDGLDLHLPASNMYTGKLIRVGTKVWEVWSPNSKRSPFYPGKAVAGHVYGITCRPEEKRSDGHLGRFDYTVSPQVAGPLWWSFITRHAARKESSAAPPEFRKVYDCWIGEPAEGRDKGRLEEQFISQLVERNNWADEAMKGKADVAKVDESAWAKRPAYPTRAGLIQLEGTFSYSQAVDFVTEAQRGIKEKVAWLDWAKRCLLRPSVKEGAETRLVLRANDQYMGRWINGLSKALVLWLLEEHIPCFVAHALTAKDLLVFAHCDATFLPGFVRQSEAEELTAERNGYEAKT